MAQNNEAKDKNPTTKSNIAPNLVQLSVALASAPSTWSNHRPKQKDAIPRTLYPCQTKNAPSKGNTNEIKVTRLGVIQFIFDSVGIILRASLSSNSK